MGRKRHALGDKMLGWEQTTQGQSPEKYSSVYTMKSHSRARSRGMSCLLNDHSDHIQMDEVVLDRRMRVAPPGSCDSGLGRRGSMEQHDEHSGGFSVWSGHGTGSPRCLDRG